jgi:hypothetical protein
MKGSYLLYSDKCGEPLSVSVREVRKNSLSAEGLNYWRGNVLQLRQPLVNVSVVKISFAREVAYRRTKLIVVTLIEYINLLSLAAGKPSQQELWNIVVIGAFC